MMFLTLRLVPYLKILKTVFFVIFFFGGGGSKKTQKFSMHLPHKIFWNQFWTRTELRKKKLKEAQNIFPDKHSEALKRATKRAFKRESKRASESTQEST